MNKTININLGGIFFHIDEDAYKKLKRYLDAIRKSLSDDPNGKDEIITDIESRIGEILSESIKDVRQVVNEQDIEDIILIMGKPEEYAGDEEFFDDESNNSSSKKRKSKKLFRDSEDKFLGGVSSGLAHYFNFDVIWIRLIWLLLMYKGTGLILYVILWILLPETKSTSDKLEMEGEDVNISNIERKIKEGFQDASQLLKDGVDDVSTHIKDGNYQSKVRTGLQEIIDLISKVFLGIFKVAGKFIGILLIVVSILTLFTVVAGGFSLGSIEFLGLSNELTKFPPFFYTSRIPAWLLAVFGFTIIGIPFVFLFKLGLKIISSNVSKFTRATNLSLLGVWLLAVMGISFAGIEYGAHSASKFSMSDRFGIDHLKVTDTLKIKMIPLEEFEARRYHEDKTVFIGDTEQSYRTNIKINIKESNSNSLYLMVYKKANGISIDKAKEFTKAIQYKFEVINNTLMLDSYFLGKLAHIHDSQYVRMTLFVPNGMTVYLDKSMRDFLNDIDNYQNLYDRNMVKHYYAMDDEGLDCLDCQENNKESNDKEEKEIEQVSEIKEVKSDTKALPIKKIKSNDAETTHNNVKQKLDSVRAENK